MAELLGISATSLPAMAINGIMAGLIDASLQGLLAGFHLKDISLAEVISTAFTAAGSTWLAEVSSVNTKTIQVLEKVLGRT